MKLFIETKKAKKGENNWTALYADLGYRAVILSMETAVIAEIADMKISELLALEAGKKIILGDVVKTK